MSKLWLDDKRPAPEGWYWAKTVPEARQVFRRGDVAEASLDHDLGDELPETGYDLLCWIENKIATNDWPWPVPTLAVHSDNGGARTKMGLAIGSIRRLAA